MSRAVCCALVLIVAGGASAAETIAVVDVATPPTMVALGGQLTQLLLRSAREQKLAVRTPDEVRSTLEEVAYHELLQCGGDPGCVADKAGPNPPERIAGGSLDRTDTTYELHLWIVDVASRKLHHELKRSIPIASRRLIADAEAALPHLLKGEDEPPATLHVSADAHEVEVRIDGALHGRAPLSVKLPPGQHAVRLEREGLLATARTVELESGEEERLAVRMLPAPLTAEDAHRPPRTVTTVTRPGGLRVPAAAIGAFVLGAGAVGTGIGFELGARSARERGDPGLAERRTAWSRGLLIGGGAAVLVGGAFTLWDTLRSGPTVDEAKPSLAIVPHGSGAVLCLGGILR